MKESRPALLQRRDLLMAKCGDISVDGRLNGLLHGCKIFTDLSFVGKEYLLYIKLSFISLVS